MIFIDTGAWVARFSKRDQYHQTSLELWMKLRVSGGRVVTSDSVMVETIALLGRRIGPHAAVEAGRFMQGWKALHILRATKQEEMTALNLLEKFADKEMGFVDCLSFALMRHERIQTAFTFDRHFEKAGFRVFG